MRNVEEKLKTKKKKVNISRVEWMAERGFNANFIIMDLEDTTNWLEFRLFLEHCRTANATLSNVYFLLSFHVCAFVRARLCM